MASSSGTHFPAGRNLAMKSTGVGNNGKCPWTQVSVLILWVATGKDPHEPRWTNQPLVALPNRVGTLDAWRNRFSKS
jgi:hypothetical protein